MTKHIVNPDGLMSLKKAGVEIGNEQTDIQLVSQSDLGRVAAEESFMNERVKVRLHPSTNPNDSPVAIITCNNEAGRTVIPRGQIAEIARHQLEILARLKQVAYTQRAAIGGDLESGNYLYPNVGYVYPFEVIEDKNPKGRAWLENIMAEPV
jgi:hypothetical protein